MVSQKDYDIAHEIVEKYCLQCNLYKNELELEETVECTRCYEHVASKLKRRLNI